MCSSESSTNPEKEGNEGETERHKWGLREEIFKEEHKKTKVSFGYMLSYENKFSDTQPQKILSNMVDI